MRNFPFFVSPSVFRICIQSYEKVKERTPSSFWESDPWAGLSKLGVVTEKQLLRPSDWLEEWPSELRKEFWEVFDVVSSINNFDLSFNFSEKSCYVWDPLLKWSNWSREPSVKWVRVNGLDMKDWSQKDDEMIQALGVHLWWDFSIKEMKEEWSTLIESYGLMWMNQKKYRFWVSPSMDIVQIAMEEWLLKHLGFSPSLASDVSLERADIRRSKEILWKSFVSRLGSEKALETLWVAVILANENILRRPLV